MSAQTINPRDYFSMLVTQLTAGARLQLGLDPNPATGKPTPNLAAARLTVGILESLLFKTAGNLSKSEDRLLSAAVRELKEQLIKKTGA